MITIQKATIDNAAAIAEIGGVSFLESHGHSASGADIDLYVSRKYTLNAVREELENPGHIYHLIYFRGQAAGYSKIVLDATNDHIPAQNVTTLDRLYLLKDFYDLKLGAALLEFNINISRQANQAGMWLHTWVENKRAVAFYHKAGFKIIGKADFKISDTHSNPNHVMYLEYGAA